MKPVAAPLPDAEVQVDLGRCEQRQPHGAERTAPLHIWNGRRGRARRRSNRSSPEPPQQTVRPSPQGGLGADATKTARPVGATRPALSVLRSGLRSVFPSSNLLEMSGDLQKSICRAATISHNPQESKKISGPPGGRKVPPARYVSRRKVRRET